MNKDIIRFAYGRGAFDESSVAMTASIFLFYMLGVLFYGARDFLNRAFHALSNTKTPMRFAMISVTVNIVLNLLLKPIMGANGLALATTLSAAVSVTMMFVTLSRRMDGLPLREMGVEMAKMLIAGAVCGAACMGMKLVLPDTLGTLPVFLRLCAATAVSMIAYAAALIVLRVKQVRTVLHMFK